MSFYFICKIPPVPEPMKEYTVGSSVVYSFLHVVCRKSSWQGGAAASEREYGKGILQEAEKPGNLLHLVKQNMYVNRWKMTGAASS